MLPEPPSRLHSPGLSPKVLSTDLPAHPPNHHQNTGNLLLRRGPKKKKKICKEDQNPYENFQENPYIVKTKGKGESIKKNVTEMKYKYKGEKQTQREQNNH